MFDLFIFSAHRAQARQNENKRGRYPRTRLLTLLMKRGTTWTPAGGKNENTRRAPRIVVCWNITVSQRMKSWNKVGDASQKNKIGEKYRRWKELLRVGLSLYPVLCERVRDIESMLERERERERETACMCVSEAHWMQRTGCWSAPPPLRSTLRHGWRKQEDVRVMSGVM